MKHLLHIIPLLAFSVARAQSPDSIINRYCSAYPCEQTYLQPDNNFYFPGDTIWFKGYIVDNGTPSPKTKNLYVDWFNEKGKLISHQTFAVEHGVVSGQYALPLNFEDSNLHVAAYTRWMLNDNRNFIFHRDFSVVQPEDTKTAKSKSKAVASGPSLALFPEGGSLVAGTINKVAFRTDWTTHPTGQIHGIIKDGKGQQLTVFTSNTDGIGSFYLTPQAGSTYSAEWQDASGTTYQAPLPAVYPSGIAMEVHQAPKERTILLRRSANPGWYYLVGTFSGTVTYFSRVNLQEKDSLLCHIPIESYPDGALTLTVLDTSWNDIAERTVLIRDEDKTMTSGNLELTINQADLSKQEDNKITLHYTGSRTADLSVAITDAAVPEDNRVDLNSYIPLAGQLQYYDRLPSHYFTDKGLQGAEERDLAALTGGGRHSSWRTAMSGRAPVFTYPMDTSYFILSGKINSSKIKPEALSFMIRRSGDLIMDTLALSASGSIADTALIPANNTWVQYLPGTNTKGYKFSFDQLPPAAWETYPFADQKSFSETDPTPTALASKSFTSRYGSLLQAAIVVRGKKLTRTDSLERIYESTSILENHGFTHDLHGPVVYNNLLQLLYYLMSELPSYPPTKPVRGGTGGPSANTLSKQMAAGNSKVSSAPPSLPISSDYKMGTATPEDAFAKLSIYLDESPITFRKEETIPPIVFVKWYPRGLPALSLKPTLLLYTERYAYNATMYKPERNANAYLISGYVSGEYFNASSAGSDNNLRRTLYWNPSVSVSAKNNTLNLAFANNELGGPMRIVIEGMDEDGTPIHLEKIIKKNSRASCQK